MAFDPKIHHRKNIRLRGYDYAQAGLYFVTLCTQNRQCLYGEIADGEMKLNEAGKMLLSSWEQIPAHYSGIEIDQFTVMPNHIHGIIKIAGVTPHACLNAPKNGQPQGVAPTGLSLPDVVHRYKTLTTKKYTDGVKQNGWQPYAVKLWQRNYYEHIIRNEDAYIKILEYIQTNPLRWAEDIYHV